MSMAALVRRMAEAGAPPEAIAIALEAIEAAQAVDADRRRKRAEQKAKERREKREPDNGGGPDGGHMSHDVRATVARHDSDGRATHPLDKKEIPPTPPKEKNSTPPVSLRERGSDAQARARVGGSRLPAEWAPSEALSAFAGVLGFAGHSLDEAVAEFRDFWRGVPGQRGRKLDWDATFRNRLRETAGKKRGNTYGNGKRGSISDVVPGFIERLDKQFAYLDEVRPEDRGPEGGPTVRLLPAQRGQRS